MKKHLLVMAAGLLTTVAVTATVLSSNKAANKRPAKEIKCTHEHHCNRTAMRTCPF